MRIIGKDIILPKILLFKIFEFGYNTPEKFGFLHSSC